MITNRKEIKLYKAKSILDVTEKDSLYCLKADNEAEFRIVVTDAFGNPVNLKDLTGGAITNVINTDGTITVTGAGIKDIKLSASLYSLINSALQAGDNISSLTNDENFITLGDIPAFNPTDYDLTDFTNSDVDPFARVSDIVSGSGITSVVAGTNVSIDNTDPLNPIISSTFNPLDYDLDDFNNLSVDPFARISDLSGTTNLGYTASPTNGIVTSSTGTDATLPLADNTNAGLLSPAEKSEIATAVQPADLGAVATSNSYNDLDDLPTIPSGVTNLSYTPSPADGTVVSDTGSDATIPVVDYTNAGLQTPSDKQLEYNNASTGVIAFSGLSINIDNTKFNVGALKGWFVDNTTDPEQPTKTYVDFPQSLANTLANIATQNVTYIAIDATGVLHESGIPFEPEVQRDWIPLGVIVHSNRTTINAVNNQPVVALSPNNQLSDLIESIGFFNIYGNVFSANGVNLNINKSAGHVFKQGSNFINDNKDPHTLPLIALTAPSNIRYRLQDGTEYSNTSVIDPNNWDDGGVLTAMTGNNWSIQRIYVFQSNLIRIQYGQATYATKADAIEAISTEAFVVEQNILENGLFRGLLLVKRSVTDLTDTTKALFIEASKFGSVAGLGSLSTTSMQQAYDNSITPEIVTDSTLGAVTIKRGSASDSDNVLEIQNGAGTDTFRVNGNGDVSGNNLSGINTGDQDLTDLMPYVISAPASTVSFERPYEYGSFTTPLSLTSIANNLTNARKGVVQKIYNNSLTEPTPPIGWVKLFGTYTPSVTNIIYCVWAGGDRVEYWTIKATP